MMGYLVFVAIVAVAVAVFTLQNTAAVNVRFVVWEISGVPLAAVVLAALGAGMVIVGLPLWFLLWRARSRTRMPSAPFPPRASPPEPPLEN
jgi:uncharacterized integral membrane protein